MLTGDGGISRHRRPERRPVRRVPQLLRLARLRDPAAHRARAGARRTSPCGTSASTTSTLLAGRVERGRRDAAVRRGAGRRARRRGVRAGGGLPDAGAVGRRSTTAAGRHRPATTPASEIYYRSIQQRETDLLTMLRLPVALGHRLVLVLGRVRRCSDPRCGGSGRAAGAAATSSTSSSASRRRFGVKARIDRARGLPAARAGHPGRRDTRSSGSPSSSPGSTSDVGMRPVWLCPLRLRTARRLAVVPARARRDLRQRRLLGHRPDRARRPRRRPQPRGRGRGRRARRAQVALLRRLLRPGDLRPALRPVASPGGSARRPTRTDG